MRLIITMFLLVFSLKGFTQTAQRQKHFNVDKNFLAIEGYDPVTYFNASEPLKGKNDLIATSNGITYHFSSPQNRELFKANPSKYEPQFGGWCAYAMGKNGEKVSVDPETYKIVNGKLYLYYNRFLTNTLKDWNKNENTLKQKADQNWLKFN